MMRIAVGEIVSTTGVIGFSTKNRRCYNLIFNIIMGTLIEKWS